MLTWFHNIYKGTSSFSPLLLELGAAVLAHPLEGAVGPVRLGQTRALQLRVLQVVLCAVRTER